jgi:hypothetical protein
MTITLETLRADFIAKLRALKETNKDNRTGFECIDILAERARAARKAKSVLDLAEQYGLRAAMLYKLSDGAIDPRKAGQQ